MPLIRSRFGFAALLASLSMLGPFSIDTYLPAFPAMAETLPATAIEVQQTLTAYLLAFGTMMLWHGTLSDSLGRRPVILVSLVIFIGGSIGCWLADSIATLWIFRAVQGLSAGAGIVVGRAMIRDRYEGPDAQRLMSLVTMIFSLAPAAAPVIGGYVFGWLGWRAIFGFLTVLSAVVFIICYIALPETLPRERRQSLRPANVLANYWRVFHRREFQLLAAMLAFNFSGLFLYVASAPILIVKHLGLSPNEFGYLFIPAVSGIFLGSFVSNRSAGKIKPQRSIFIAFAIMFTATIANVVYHTYYPPALPWSIIPIAVYSFGMSIIMPEASIMVLDLFPNIRGLVSSFQGFTQTTVNAAVAGLLAPLLFFSPISLAYGHLGICAAGFAAWLAYIGTNKLALQKARA